MKLIIDPLASDDLDTIGSWIENVSPLAAQTVLRKIMHGIEQLEQFPELGHAGRAQGSYERAVSGTNYLIIYQLRPDAVIVTAVFDTAQDRPRF